MAAKVLPFLINRSQPQLPRLGRGSRARVAQRLCAPGNLRYLMQPAAQAVPAPSNPAHPHPLAAPPAPRRHALAISQACTGLATVLMTLTAPVSWPLAKLLDWLLDLAAQKPKKLEGATRCGPLVWKLHEARLAEAVRERQRGVNAAASGAVDRATPGMCTKPCSGARMLVYAVACTCKGRPGRRAGNHEIVCLHACVRPLPPLCTLLPRLRTLCSIAQLLPHHLHKFHPSHHGAGCRVLTHMHASAPARTPPVLCACTSREGEGSYQPPAFIGPPNVAGGYATFPPSLWGIKQAEWEGEADEEEGALGRWGEVRPDRSGESFQAVQVRYEGGEGGGHMRARGGASNCRGHMLARGRPLGFALVDAHLTPCGTVRRSLTLLRSNWLVVGSWGACRKESAAQGQGRCMLARGRPSSCKRKLNRRRARMPKPRVMERNTALPPSEAPVLSHGASSWCALAVGRGACAWRLEGGVAYCMQPGARCWRRWGEMAVGDREGVCNGAMAEHACRLHAGNRHGRRAGEGLCQGMYGA